VVQENPLGCATLLPVKIRQKFGDGEMILKNGQNFTGKSVAQQESPFYYKTRTRLPYKEIHRTEVQSSNKSAPTIRGQPKGGTLNYDRRSESRRDDVETQGLPSLVQGRHRHARELCTSPQ
jgi:hypothetical protein